MKFASSLSVNCHDSQFHRLPTMKFASSLSANCHDRHFHRLPSNEVCIEFVSKLSRRSVSLSTDHQFNFWSVDGETDRRDSLLTNSMQNIEE